MIDETTGGLVYELKKAGELGEGSAFTARLEVSAGGARGELGLAGIARSPLPGCAAHRALPLMRVTSGASPLKRRCRCCRRCPVCFV